MNRVLAIGIWCAIAMLEALSLAREDPEQSRPDLTGQVVDSVDCPVPGAHVFIYTAAVKRGTNTLCPSCYTDCAKSAVSDANGRFRISSLDPELVFRVLVVGEGYQPTFVKSVDPAHGPIKAALLARDLSEVPQNRIVRGTVIAPDGKPVVGAILEASLFSTEAHSGYKPGIFDPVAVTDGKGCFVMTATSPINSVRFKVEARGFCSVVMRELKPESETKTIQLTVGSFVRGRVMQEGKPVTGISVVLCQVERQSEFVGAYTIATDENGFFVFSNVPAHEKFVVYGIMETLREKGAIPVKEIQTGEATAVTDVGALEIGPGHRLSGQVILSDRKPIPPKTRLGIHCQSAWDHQTVELDVNGEFSVEGLPSELYSINIEVPGYHVSEQNISLDPLNRRNLLGRIDQSCRIAMLLDPGQGIHNTNAGRLWRAKSELFGRLRRLPITGMRESTDSAGTVSGAMGSYEDIDGLRRLINTPDEPMPPVSALESKEIGRERSLIRFTLSKDLGRKGYRVAWRPNGKELGFLEFNSPVEILDPNYKATGSNHGEKVTHFDFDPMEKTFAFNGQKDIFVLDRATGRRLRLEAASDQPTMAYSPDGQTLAVAGYGNEVSMWRVVDGERTGTFRVEGREGGLTPAFGPDGKILAVGNRNDTTHLIEVQSSKILHVLNRAMSQGLAFSKDGKRLAVGYVDGFLGIWEVSTGKLEKLLPSGVEEVFAVTWSPDGNLLASGGLKGPVRIWSATHLAKLHELNSGSERTFSLAFAPDGNSLVATGSETTRIWNIDRLQEPQASDSSSLVRITPMVVHGLDAEAIGLSVVSPTGPQKDQLSSLGILTPKQLEVILAKSATKSEVPLESLLVSSTLHGFVYRDVPSAMSIYGKPTIGLDNFTIDVSLKVEKLEAATATSGIKLVRLGKLADETAIRLTIWDHQAVVLALPGEDRKRLLILRLEMTDENGRNLRNGS